ncbi:MAG: hypothetical protein JWM34_690 [Ilumatobacteraceae bacterium]|nr:hypothetical protein [Ilumatobacteraceae bacterium]
MTLSDTVTSFAHDAASAASDLGSQAAELGRSAADASIDAASTVASAAGHLAHTLRRQAPIVVQRKRSKTPWVIAVLIAAVAAGAVVFRGKRNSGSIAPVAPAEDAAEATTAKPKMTVAHAS